LGNFFFIPKYYNQNQVVAEKEIYTLKVFGQFICPPVPDTPGTGGR
jgi:hypothetical protein